MKVDCELQARGYCRDRGSTIVEFSIVLPLFLLFVFSVIAFGRFTSRESALEHALRQAGRYGATLEGDCLTPAMNRFFAGMAGSSFASGLTFQGNVVRLSDNTEALQLVVLAAKDDFLPFTIGVRATGLFPVEVPDGCYLKQVIVASSPSPVESPPPNPNATSKKS
jgi:Flp pilus assembly protein TadG